MNLYDIEIKSIKLQITKFYDKKDELYSLDISNEERYIQKTFFNEQIVILKNKLNLLRKKNIDSDNHYLTYFSASKDKITFKDFFKDKFKDEKSYHLKYSWGRFVYQILKNPFMKSYKLQEQKGKCSCCHTDINKELYVLHHRTYNYLCMNTKTIDTKDGSQYPIVPDCESCSVDNPKRFKDCMSKLDYVHQSCHDKIHGIDNTTTTLK